jgi:hypothetical protein
MLIVLGTALLLLALGSTVLGPVLNPHEHPGRFILFWVVCGWLTVTSILLAVLDLLLVKLQSRRAQRALRDNLKEKP